MSRRQTLGSLSNGALVNRSSMGPSRITEDAGGPPSKAARKSIAPNGILSAGSGLLGDLRRSSVHGSTKPGAPKPDPRQLNDKGVQANFIRQIIMYLETHGYADSGRPPVTPKMLASPTGKDFALIAQFLLHQMDPHLQLGKVEDDVPLMFKRLSYPFQISKSALFAVGSPHSWPAVLAALAWLVELLNYNERDMGRAQPSLHDGLDNRDISFFNYASASYTHFLSGNDAGCEVEDDKMMENFKIQEAAIEEQRRRVRQARQQVQAELDTMRSELDPVTAARACLAEAQADQETYLTLIPKQKDQISKLQRKLQLAAADVASKADQLAAAAKEKQQLGQRVASQTVNKAELQRMLLERHKQKEALDELNAQVEEAQRKLHDEELQIARSQRALEATAQQYNGAARRLKLIPATTKRAEGTLFELQLNREPSASHELANLDLKGVVKPKLERLFETYRRKTMDLGADLTHLKEAAVGVTEQLQEQTEERAATEQQIYKLEAQLRDAKDEKEAQIRIAAEQAERLRADVAALRNAACGRAADVNARIAATEQEHEAMQRTCAEKVDKLHSELRLAVQMLVQHKTRCQARLQEATATVRAVSREVAAMPLPKAPSSMAAN